MSQVWWWLALGLGGLSLVFLVSGVAALFRRRLFGCGVRLLFACVFFLLAALLGGIVLGVQGYRALTNEEVAATVRTEPVGPKRFRAHFRFVDGRETSYTLQGDELYVDARVLKWRPIANILGLHTTYELDRVAGRYVDLAEEQGHPRTIYTLIPDRTVDLFALRKRYAAMSPLLDAEYGSATFTAADAPAQFEVRVSTTGLLVRRMDR
ncbi:MAG TPA: hypothetical protein VJS66_03960 [Burkholderiales bacterium]|nr:hypothetical protein [Burkholderiales bacterium]